VLVLPGENELRSLALGILRVVRGEEVAHDYCPPSWGRIDGPPISTEPLPGSLAAEPWRAPPEAFGVVATPGSGDPAVEAPAVVLS
jgi:hypothetical protein